MSLKSRGQEATLRLAVDGVVQEGSMFKVMDFTATPRTDLVEDDYLGEQETDLDIQHHGWDIGFSVNTIDSTALDLIDEIIAREQAHTAHPDITLTAIYTFRDPGTRGKIYIYHEIFLKADEEGFGSRKDRHKVKFSGKAKKRVPLDA
jgi:hypothetical protein